MPCYAVNHPPSRTADRLGTTQRHHVGRQKPQSSKKTNKQSPKTITPHYHHRSFAFSLSLCAPFPGGAGTSGKPLRQLPAMRPVPPPTSLPGRQPPSVPRGAAACSAPRSAPLPVPLPAPLPLPGAPARSAPYRAPEGPARPFTAKAGPARFSPPSGVSSSSPPFLFTLSFLRFLFSCTPHQTPAPAIFSFFLFQNFFFKIYLFCGDCCWGCGEGRGDFHVGVHNAAKNKVRGWICPPGPHGGTALRALPARCFL